MVSEQRREDKRREDETSVAQPKRWPLPVALEKEERVYSLGVKNQRREESGTSNSFILNGLELDSLLPPLPPTLPFFVPLEKAGRKRFFVCFVSFLERKREETSPIPC